MAGIESMLGGFAKGFAQGKMMKVQREEKKQMTDLQKRLAEIQIQNAKSKQKETEFKNAILQQFFPQLQGEQPGPTGGPGAIGEFEKTSFGKSFQQGETPAAGGVTDMISQMQMNPLMAAMMKELTGIDFPGAMNQNVRMADFMRGFSEKKTVKVPDGKGGFYYMEAPKYGSVAGRGGNMLGYEPPNLGSFNVETPEGTFRQPVNQTTQEPVGQPIKTGKAKGESSETASKIALATTATEYIKGLKDAFVNPDGSIDRTLVIKSNAPMGGIGEGRKIYGMFLDALDARARAATGAAMPESEIKTYTRIYFPSPLDDDATIKDKLNRLQNFMKDYLETMDPNSTIRNRLKKGGIVEENLPPDDPLGIR